MVPLISLRYNAFLKAKISASEPTRPTIMLIMMNVFPREDNADVIPMERPCVQKADIDSNIRSKNENVGSLKRRQKVMKVIHALAKATIEIALNT